jgi:UDP-N-acetylmuramoyl-L-alanyl-D-glutamate--2,6-diaminopimelate ligase
MDLFTQLARQGAMIERLAADSRRCASGVAFFACPGERADGRQFIPDALARGAAAVLWEADGFAWRDAWRVPNLPVPGLRRQAGALAHEFYGRPSAALWTCGVTGTNGKTTCSQWIAAALTGAGRKCGVIGTLGAGFPGALEDSGHTTPDALDVHRLLADMRRAGARAAAMEVSSHALQQDRVGGVAFDCALFTNLSHDHLDYHGSMDAYAAAKARLFETQGLACAVLNLDDVFGAQLAQRLAARGVRTIGTSLFSAAATGEYLCAAALNGARVDVTSNWGEAQITLAALGRFNVANALGVAGALIASGMDFTAAMAALERLPDVPGRMQRLGGAGAPLVVIDYAHSPDALDKVLQALRPVADARGGRLVAVFGAGGERDRAKRAPMGAIVSRLADRIVLTSDNPRGEDPMAILHDVQAGVGVGVAHELEPDRARAIASAIAGAAAADVVLLAGKGHETTQEVAGRRLPFSDVAVARAALGRRETQ